MSRILLVILYVMFFLFLTVGNASGASGANDANVKPTWLKSIPDVLSEPGVTAAAAAGDAIGPHDDFLPADSDGIQTLHPGQIAIFLVEIDAGPPETSDGHFYQNNNGTPEKVGCEVNGPMEDQLGSNLAGLNNSECVSSALKIMADNAMVCALGKFDNIGGGSFHYWQICQDLPCTKEQNSVVSIRLRDDPSGAACASLGGVFTAGDPRGKMSLKGQYVIVGSYITSWSASDPDPWPTFDRPHGFWIKGN